MDITTWSMVRTINQALDIIDDIGVPHFGLMLDLYNTWWDPQIVKGIRRAGAGGPHQGRAHGRLAQPHALVHGPHHPRPGHHPARRLIAEVEDTGWSGSYDVEIFSDELWGADYDALLDETVPGSSV